jgi:hypothetical protein
MTRRCVIGRDVAVIEETDHDVYIESGMRLRPGSVIDLCDHRVRPALVATWMVARLGRDGPVFRGTCTWAEPGG